MLNETNNQDTQKTQDDSRTSNERELSRIANEAAGRASRRQQRYDREHNIFTK